MNETEAIWQRILDNGCEWCGRKIPALDSVNLRGKASYGLEFAHILAAQHGPRQHWNGFALCPTCHRLFDRVVKPKIVSALERAVTGFRRIPTHKNSVVRTASSYKEAVEQMLDKPLTLKDPDRTVPHSKASINTSHNNSSEATPIRPRRPSRGASS